MIYAPAAAGKEFFPLALKLPTCIGPARRVVLDQLGNRYRRRFADAWQFVRFAQEQHLDLDFTSPPQRPEPAGMAAVKP